MMVPRAVHHRSSASAHRAPPSAIARAPSSAKPLIVIDGPNVAIKHGQRAKFSSRGIQLALEYWQQRGHRALAFMPEHHLNFERVGSSKRAAALGLAAAKHIADDVPLLQALEKKGEIVITPSQDYDDACCIAYARAHPPACIVTSDMYRDYVEAEGSRGRSKREADEWRRRHLISFTFLMDEFLPNPEFVFPSA